MFTVYQKCNHITIFKHIFIVPYKANLVSTDLDTNVTELLVRYKHRFFLNVLFLLFSSCNLSGVQAFPCELLIGVCIIGDVQ